MSYKIASALLGVLAFATPHSAVSAELPTLRYGGGGDGLPQLPLVIAQKEGFFTKEGLNFEVVKNAATGPDSNSQAALKGYEASIERGGRADMTGANAGFFIDAVLNGSDAVAIGVVTANPVYSLIVRPEIKTYADLKGKTITLTAPWDGITLTSRALLAKHGIGRSDFKFEAIKMSDARLECMKAGKCAAIVAVHPTDIQAINMGLGFHRLGTTLEAGPVTFYIDVVRREWAKTNKDTIVRFLRAQADAMRFIHDPKNRDEVAKTIAEGTHVSQEIVNQLVDTYADPKMRVLPKQGELDMASFNNLLQFAKDSGNWDKPFPPAEKFVDLSFAKAAGIQ
jgi:ABC-type nitrate/sulfonate/bicarbonate transport system substrate-binding protein